MAAHLWPLSRTTVLDLNGDIAPGALLNFYVAGTTTPLVVYSDSGLSVPRSNVIEADAAGRWPAVYMPYTDYRQRVRTAGGTLIFDDDGIANPAPSSSGGGGTVPNDQIYTTGDTKWSFGTGALEGFVRLNGRTIGNAGSGANERANDDIEDLYVWLWDRLSNTFCPVSGGRGGSGAADFAAGKTLTLPDLRGRGVSGVDDMGASAADRLLGTTFLLGDRTTPGSSAGADTHTLTEAQMPAHNHPGSVASPAGNHQHGYLQNPNSGGFTPGGTPGASSQTGGNTDITGAHQHGLSITTQGSNAPHPNMQPTVLVTWYIHL